MEEPIKEAVKEAKVEEVKEDLESKHDKVAKNLENIYATRLKEKAEELGKIEEMIDKKISDFKDFVNKTALGGRSFAQEQKTAEQTRAEKIESEYQKWRRAARGS